MCAGSGTGRWHKPQLLLERRQWSYRSLPSIPSNIIWSKTKFVTFPATLPSRNMPTLNPDMNMWTKLSFHSPAKAQISNSNRRLLSSALLSNVRRTWEMRQSISQSLMPTQRIPRKVKGYIYIVFIFVAGQATSLCSCSCVCAARICENMDRFRANAACCVRWKIQKSESNPRSKTSYKWYKPIERVTADRRLNKIVST